MNNNTDKPNIDYNEQEIIKSWRISSFCLINSRSDNKWEYGQITDIIVDKKTKEEWLIVQYKNNKKKKKIQRYCPDIKIIPQNNILSSLNFHNNCLIYSTTNNKWCKGTVISIFNDNEGEWLKIQYNENNMLRMCDIQKYSKEIKFINDPDPYPDPDPDPDKDFDFKTTDYDLKPLPDEPDEPDSDDSDASSTAMQTQPNQLVDDGNSNNSNNSNKQDIVEEKENNIVNDSKTWLSVVQMKCLMSNGYCLVDTMTDCKDILFLITGYIRLHFVNKPIIRGLIIQIATCYGGRYDETMYVKLVSSEDQIELQGHYLISRKAVLLSNLCKTTIAAGGADTDVDVDVDVDADTGNDIVMVKMEKVRKDILEYICQYLGHHNGKKPEEIAKPIRSVKMERIVADLWDANFINKLNKKTIFEIIIAAKYMDIPSLVHLGCAKIATLIKGKSPEEIKNILADDDD